MESTYYVTISRQDGKYDFRDFAEADGFARRVAADGYHGSTVRVYGPDGVPVAAYYSDSGNVVELTP